MILSLKKLFKLYLKISLFLIFHQTKALEIIKNVKETLNVKIDLIKTDLDYSYIFN